MADLPLETLSEVDPAAEPAPGQPQPHLFRVLECSRPLAASSRHGLDGVDRVEIGRGERRCHRGSPARRMLELAVPDPWMSSSHARLVRRDGAWFIEDAGSRNGTLVNGAAIERGALADGDVVEIGRTLFVFRAAVAAAPGDPADLDASGLSPVVAELASLCPPLADQLSALVRVASATVSVVVQGETGTGKERIAHAVHVLSRRPGAFVAVNCGALPDTLLEAELFGSRRGAFTGAQDRPGLIRTADQGTLFLDEVGDLPLPAQGALLRVLQERQVHAIGAPHPVAVDFRLLCATQEPLDQLVRAGRFRDDLRARLAGFTIQLPPLRERREDLGIITATLLRRLAPGRAEQLSFDKEAARALLLHAFPLNIRELEKALERALALADDDRIRLKDLSLAVAALAEVPAGTAPIPTLAPLAPEDLAVKHQLVAALREHAGNVSATARSMGKARAQIRRWLRRYQIDLAQFRR